MEVDELWERYNDLATEGPLPLEEFVQMAASGALGGGPVEPQVLERFLRRVEAMMLANIETKLEEAPQFHAMRDQAVERTQAMIADLIARYATRPGPLPPGSGPAQGSPEGPPARRA